MKMKWIVFVVLILMVGLGSYKTYVYLTREEEIKEEVAVPVTVQTIEMSSYEDVLSYEGVISPDRIEKISFKSTARLAEFNGAVGETIEQGALLAALDKADLQLALDAADSQLAAAKADFQRASKGAAAEDIQLATLNIDKATASVDYFSQKVEELIVLVENGLAAQNDLDGMQLQLDLAVKDKAMAETTLEKALKGADSEIIKAAGAQVNLAQTNVEAKTMLIEDATYMMPEPMILLQRLYELGELVPAGYPVAILRSEGVNVIIGVTGKDLKQIYAGQKAHLSAEGTKIDGQVTRIAEIPDEHHFLYEVEVKIENNPFIIGEIVRCDLVIGKKEVIQIPIFAIMNDGIDYVYCVNNEVATIKKIEIVGTDEGYAFVKGLDEGDRIIVSNLNRVHEQSKLLIEE